ncbi:MAG: hypothetical protein [Malazfec virus 1]
MFARCYELEKSLRYQWNERLGATLDEFAKNTIGKKRHSDVSFYI